MDVDLFLNETKVSPGALRVNKSRHAIPKDSGDYRPTVTGIPFPIPSLLSGFITTHRDLHLFIFFVVFYYRPHPKDDGRLYFHFVCQSTPGGGGTRSQIFGGGYQVSDFWGGYQVSDFCGGGYMVSDFQGGGYMVSVKGKLFDTRFGLIHVQTGKKNFVKGPPPPPGMARNCYGYTAGGMPLAFTQEDFLVLFINAEVDLRDTIRFAIVNILLLRQVFACSQKQCHNVSSSFLDYVALKKLTF